MNCEGIKEQKMKKWEVPERGRPSSRWGGVTSAALIVTELHLPCHSDGLTECWRPWTLQPVNRALAVMSTC